MKTNEGLITFDNLEKAITIRGNDDLRQIIYEIFKGIEKMNNNEKGVDDMGTVKIDVTKEEFEIIEQHRAEKKKADLRHKTKMDILRFMIDYYEYVHKNKLLSNSEIFLHYASMHNYNIKINPSELYTIINSVMYDFQVQLIEKERFANE